MPEGNCEQKTEKLNMNKTTSRILMVAIAIAVAAWIGYLSTQPEKIKGSDFKMEVFKVEIPEMPLCDAQHTANCYISKIDLEALSNGKLNH